MSVRLPMRVRTALRFVRQGRFRALRATLERGLFPAPIFRKNRLLIASLARPRRPAEDLADFDLRWADRSDLPLLERIRPRRREFERFLDGGSLPLIGLQRGVPRSFSWIELDPSHVSRPNAYHFPLGPGAAWSFAWAGRLEDPLLFAWHWWHKMRLLARSGISEVYLAVQADDHVERAAHRAAGFELVFELDVLRLLGATVHRVEHLPSGERRAYGFGAWRG